MTSTSIEKYKEPRRLHGLPGTIYVLSNTALKDNIFLVGFSRRSGWAKAAELNRDKLNTLPGSYECVFEVQAQDGGVAIETIFGEIAMLRIGKREIDFFEIAKEKLEETVVRIVDQSNLHARNKYLQHEKRRERNEAMPQNKERDEPQYQHQSKIEQQAEQRAKQRAEQQNKQVEDQKNVPKNVPTDVTIREGIFKKANLWINKALM